MIRPEIVSLKMVFLNWFVSVIIFDLNSQSSYEIKLNFPLKPRLKSMQNYSKQTENHQINFQVEWHKSRKQ